MDHDNSIFDSALADLLKSDSPSAEHIDLNTLLAYHGRSLAEIEAETVKEHLSECQECADLLLELTWFHSGESPTPDSSTPSSGAEIESVAWKELRVRLGAERARRPVPIGTDRSFRRRPMQLGLAASLFLTMFFGLRMVSMQSELAALREPQVNVAIVNLRPPDFARGEIGEGTVRGDGDRFVVILNPPSFPVDAEHSVVIEESDGTVIWSGRGLWPTDGGTFDLELTRQLLEPGRYRIRLSREGDELSEFDLRILPN